MQLSAHRIRAAHFAQSARKPLGRSVHTRSGLRHDCNTTAPDKGMDTSRRALLIASPALLAASVSQEAQAVQGLTAGRIPGERPDPDFEGYKIYQRPLGKSGGHGIGWSEIPQYSFRVPNNWKETPVSIADAGGTEIDIRMSSRDEGELSMVVAPVLRFRDVGYNANVDMEFLGDPDKIIAGFTPELYGAPLVDGDVQDTKVYRKDGALYYQWRLKPHRYVVATATGNRVFLLAASANSRQFRKSSESLQTIVDSLYVPPAKAYNVGY